MRSYYPSCHDAEGISCMLWLYNPAAKPTLCSTDGLMHGWEMPAQIKHVDNRPDSLPHNSAVPARGRICWHLARSPELAKRKSPPPHSFSVWTEPWAHKTHQAHENTAPAPRNLQSISDSTQYSLTCLKPCDSSSELSHNLHPFTKVINT